MASQNNQDNNREESPTGVKLILNKLHEFAKKYAKPLKLTLFIAVLLLLSRRLVWNRVKSISQVEKLIVEGHFRKVLLGSILMIAFPKSNRWFEYSISSMHPREPKDIFKLAQKSGIKEVSGMFPNEQHIAQTIAIIMSMSLTLFMIKTIKD